MYRFESDNSPVNVFWGDVRKFLTDLEDDEGYECDPVKVGRILDKLSDPEELAEFIYTYAKGLNE